MCVCVCFFFAAQVRAIGGEHFQPSHRLPVSQNPVPVFPPNFLGIFWTIFFFFFIFPIFLSRSVAAATGAPTGVAGRRNGGGGRGHRRNDVGIPCPGGDTGVA